MNRTPRYIPATTPTTMMTMMLPLIMLTVLRGLESATSLATCCFIS